MRLSPTDIRAIRCTIAVAVGDTAEVVLFGSRVDDSAKGGDIDLLVILDWTPANVPLTAALLAARLERALQGRRVDVVIRTPGSPPQPIHETALRTGIAL
jgi:predicted nucleotidyltransferase